MRVNIHYHTSIRLFSPVACAGANDHRPDSSVHEDSLQHVANGEDLPPLANCVLPGVYVPTARSGARAGAEYGGVTLPLQVARSPQGPTGDCQDAIGALVHVRSSSSSDSSANKKRKKRARRTRPAQLDIDGRVNIADVLREQHSLREDQRDTRVRAIEHGGPTYHCGFGTDVTNRGVVGRGQSGGGRFRGEEEPKGVSQG